MGKTLVLDRVSADLSRGRTHPAIQRLSSLVAAYPTDLDLRRRLAAVHRRVGNRIQAGRWDYLTIGADSADTTAFERAYPSPMARLRAVRWPYRASAAATSYARNRLARLMAAAHAETPTGQAPAGQAPAGHAGPSGLAGARVGRQRPPAHLLELAARRLAGRLGLQLQPRGPRGRGPRGILASATILLTMTLAVVGGVTVVEWIVQ